MLPASLWCTESDTVQWCVRHVTAPTACEGKARTRPRKHRRRQTQTHYHAIASPPDHTNTVHHTISRQRSTTAYHPPSTDTQAHSHISVITTLAADSAPLERMWRRVPIARVGRLYTHGKPLPSLFEAELQHCVDSQAVLRCSQATRLPLTQTDLQVLWVRTWCTECDVSNINFAEGCFPNSHIGPLRA